MSLGYSVADFMPSITSNFVQVTSVTKGTSVTISVGGAIADPPLVEGGNSLVGTLGICDLILDNTEDALNGTVDYTDYTVEVIIDGNPIVMPFDYNPGGGSFLNFAYLRIPPYTWDTTNETVGTHTIQLNFITPEGAIQSPTHYLGIINNLAVQIIEPVSNAKLYGLSQIMVGAQVVGFEPTDMPVVQFLLDDNFVIDTVPDAPYTALWDIPDDLESGIHTIKAIASASAGTVFSIISVNIDQPHIGVKILNFRHDDAVSRVSPTRSIPTKLYVTDYELIENIKLEIFDDNSNFFIQAPSVTAGGGIITLPPESPPDNGIVYTLVATATGKSSIFGPNPPTATDTVNIRFTGSMDAVTNIRITPTILSFGS